MLNIAILCGELILLHWISRIMINEWYYLLRVYIQKNSIIFAILAVLFLPGTIIHEFSHFLAATILLLRVDEVRIFPSWEGHHVKLGSVTYQKADFIRSILVGIAPLFGGVGVFFLIHLFRLFPQSNIWMNILMGYLIFSIASHMFSSRQDLVDLIYVLPLFLIGAALVYLFNIQIDYVYIVDTALKPIYGVANSLLFYVSFALGLNVGIIILFKSFRWLIRK